MPHITLATASDNHFTLTTERGFSFISQIPERKQDQSRFNTWQVAATDVTVDIIRENCLPHEIRFLDDLAGAKYHSLLLRTLQSEKLQEQTAAFKATKVLPYTTMQFDPRAAEYQKLGAFNALVAEGYGLFMEQGTGKTLTTISKICNMRPSHDDLLRVLIVAPNNVRHNWVKELEKFGTKEIKSRVLRGTQLARLTRLIECMKKTGQEVSVAIIGYDTIQGTLEALQLTPWDLIVLDEAHYIRNVKTNRWKNTLKLRPLAKHRMVLTGTPVANSINDLWTQLEFMGQGFSGFNTFKAFKSFFGVYDKSADTQFERLLALQNVPILKDRLSRYSYVVTKAEALPDLPDKVYDVIEVEMSDAQQEAYNKLASDLSFEIEAELQQAERAGSNQALVIQNVLTMLLKLAQITSGFLNIPAERDPDGNVLHEAKVVRFAPNAKIEVLREVLAEKLPEQKTIIWATFRHDIEVIKKLCDVEGLRAVTFYGGTSDEQRQEAERLFNTDDSYRVFIGNPRAGGTGLNLLGYPPGNPEASNSNADHVIYFSSNWSSLDRAQSEDRAHRRGTRSNVRISDLCVPATIDEAIRERVFEKRMTAFEITDIRNILKEVFNRE